MNPHILQGSIAFVLWSAFASWYYVNHIVTDNESEVVINQPVPQVEIKKEEVVEEPIDSTETKAMEPVSVDLQLSLFFDLNSSMTTSSDELTGLQDSLTRLQSTENYLLAITGYTCDLGTNRYNDSLSTARANYVANMLKPMLSSNIQIQVGGNGELAAVEGASENQRSKNRRVDIKLTN